jgi:Aspartic acid proteinase inhibitor
MKIHAILTGAALALGSAFAADTPAATNVPPLCGGYSRAEIDSGVKAAAAFAVSEQAKATGKPLRLVEAVKAERQVVAGLNYRLLLKVKEGDKILHAQAVVWRKLDGPDVLASWEWSVR